MRKFNTSGPNLPEKHYTLLRSNLVQQGKNLVYDERYFTIWAPRQTGKSTYFRFLAFALREEGYSVAFVNFENYSDASKNDFFDYLKAELIEQWNIELKSNTLESLFQEIANIKNKKCVLIVDEVEGINEAFFGVFLHGIRQVYHTRQNHGLKSVILVGVMNIVGIVKSHASPFNVAENLPVPYFTNEETFELLNQHERETGQLFEEKVKTKIAAMTANQPGLVNAFAGKLVSDYPAKPILTYEDYLKVEDWFLTESIDKNLSNIVNKAEEYRPFVEQLLFKDIKILFQIHREDIKTLYVNGIIKKEEDGSVGFRVPLYQKVLHTAFFPYTNGESDRIQSTIIVEEFYTEDGVFDINKVIERYKIYALRRRFRYFREKNEKGRYITLKEATLVYSFETFLNAFLMIVEGKSYLEAHTGLGRTDLLINVDNQEFVIEAKVFSNITQFKKGKKQLAWYAKNLNLTTAIYLVFVESEVKNPHVKEVNEMVDGIEIKTHLIAYNLEQDFLVTPS
jgi:AAA-like domain